MKNIALLMPDAGDRIDPFAYFRPYSDAIRRFSLDGYRFVLNPTEGHFDGVVVPQSVRATVQGLHAECPAHEDAPRLRGAAEYPYASGLLHTAILSSAQPIENCQSEKKLLGHSAHHWFVEIPYDDVLAKQPSKSKLISAVISNKTDTPTHQQRFEFMKRMKGPLW